MPKLFSNAEDTSPQSFSVEQHVEYITSTSYIASEAFSDYLYKVKDSFTSLVSDTIDKPASDVINTRFETLHRLKRVKYVNVAPILVSKPENFKGFYADYIKTLLEESEKTIKSTPLTLDKLKYNIAYYINEHKEGTIDTGITKNFFNKVETATDSSRNAVAKYFKAKDSKKTPLNSVLRSFLDIEDIYKAIIELDKVINHATLVSISQLAKECGELVDVLIENNISAKGKIINDTVKKDLTKAIYVSAKEVEHLSYLYSNLLIFYGVFSNLIEDIKTWSDQ